MKVESIKCYQVLNSRGLPSLEVQFKLENKEPVSVKAPQGASCGWQEPLDKIDHDSALWSGQSVYQAKKRVQELAKHLIGQTFGSPEEFDQALLKHSLKVDEEVNVALGLSFGFALSFLQEQLEPKACAHYPQPMLNVLNGGAHAFGSMSIQEVMLLPTKRTPSENLLIGHKVSSALKKHLKDQGLSTAVGDEGGFVLSGKSTKQVLDLLVKICTKLSLKPWDDYMISLDCAANEYYDQQKQGYLLDGVFYAPESYVQFLDQLTRDYPIYSIEDPFVETGFNSYSEFKNKAREGLIVVGDDLTTSCEPRLKDAIERKCIDAVILKPNQNGLFSSFEKTIKLAQRNDIKTIFSHRSGDTEDCWLTDLALHYQADFLKAGALSRSERLAKYNQLLRAEQS